MLSIFTTAVIPSSDAFDSGIHYFFKFSSTVNISTYHETRAFNIKVVHFGQRIKNLPNFTKQINL